MREGTSCPIRWQYESTDKRRALFVGSTNQQVNVVLNLRTTTKVQCRCRHVPVGPRG